MLRSKENGSSYEGPLAHLMRYRQQSYEYEFRERLEAIKLCNLLELDVQLVIDVLLRAASVPSLENCHLFDLNRRPYLE